jgi:hypothetical protein
VSGVGVAYIALGLASAWHVYTGVPLEGYLSGRHGWLIATREWLARLLLFPVLLLNPASRLALRRAITSDLPGLAAGEKVLDAVWLAEGDDLWALSDRALYVGSSDGDFWRLPFENVAAVSEVPSGPWARTSIAVSVAQRAGRAQDVSGVFTRKDGQRVMRGLPQASAGQIGVSG